MGTCFLITILPLFFPSDFMPLNYFPNCLLKSFRVVLACFLMEVVPAPQKCSSWTSLLSFCAAQTVAMKIYRPNFRGVGAPCKQWQQQNLCTDKEKMFTLSKKLNHTLICLGLLKTCKTKLSLKWEKPAGLFTFSWLRFLNSEIKQSFIYTYPCGLLNWWVFTHQLWVGQWRKYSKLPMQRWLS